MNSLSKKTKYKSKRAETIQEILFVAPQFILYFTFTILPFIIAIPIVMTNRISFMDNSVDYIGFRNFVAIFREPFISEFFPALRRTVVFTVLNYASIYIFGMTLALIMYEYNSKLKKPFFTIIYMPYMISGFGAGMLLGMLFSRDTGVLNLIMKEIFHSNLLIDIKTQGAVTWFLPVLTGWRYAGINLAFFLGGLLSIPVDTIESSVIDGASYWQKLRYIYIPQIIPSIVMATVTCLIGSFNLLDELIGMGATYGNQSAVFLSVLVFIKGFSGSGGAVGSGGLSQSVAMSLTVFVPLIIVAFGLIRWQRKMQY